MSDVVLGGLEAFRIRFAGRPVLLCLGILAVLLLIRRGTARSRIVRDWSTLATVVISVTALVALIAYPSVAVWYASHPHFFDNAEPVMPIVGWLFHVGKPVYPAIDAAERYAHIYGPFAFIAHGWALGLLGPTILVSKALGAFAGLASLVFTYLLARRHVEQSVAVVLAGLCALLLLLFRHYSFWTRPEPLQLLAVSASLYFASMSSGYLGAVFSGAAAGVLWNLKITGPMYTLPVFALLYSRRGWKALVLAAAFAVGVASFPFAYYDNVSWPQYLAWLRLSGSTGLLLSTLRQNLEWAIYLCVPLVLSYYAVPQSARPRSPAWRNVLAALVLGVTGVVIAASKPGAGPYHLIPFLPIIVFIVAWHLERRSPRATGDLHVAPVSLAFVITAVFIADAQEAQFLTTMRQRDQLRESDDITQFADAHAGVVAVGYGSTESLSLQRPVLAFRYNTYLLDQPAIREHQLQGLDLPAATTRAISECRVNYWLIPRGEDPFSGRNSYSAVLLRPLFPDEFRHVFEQAHSIVGTTTYYDVWQCHGLPDR